MTDLTKLSDAELQALFSKVPVASAPVPAPAASSLSALSDDDLKAAYAKTAPVQETPEYDVMGNSVGSVGGAPVQAGMPYAEQMGNVGKFIDNGMRATANGMTFGLADKFAGGMDAVTGNAPSYDAGVKAQRAKTAALPEGVKLAGDVVGGLATGMGLARSGVSIASHVGPRLLPRFLGFGLEGAGYGAVHGAGNTYSDNFKDYLDNAGKGASTGFLIGGAIPVGGTAASGAYRLGSAFLGPRVAGTSRGASALMRTAALADEQGIRALPQMGPEAMLVDAGPAMLGLGQGAVTGTGPGRTSLVNNLRTRDADTGNRLAHTLDTNIGPAPIPSRVEAGLRQNRRDLSPEYEAAFENSTAVDTPAVIAQIDAMIPNVRGEARAQLQRIRDDLHITDAQGNTQVPDPHPRALLAVRQSIDGLNNSTTDTNVQRILGEVRRTVDDQLQANVPGIKAADAKFAESMRQSDALVRGQEIFDTGRANVVRPAELADEIRGGAVPQGQMVGPSAAPVRLRQGARAEVDRIVGTNVNDLNALERTLATPQDWNSQKFAQVFGDDPYQRVASAIANNRRFRQAYSDIVQNSQTAQRNISARAMEGSPGGNVDAGTTVTGLGLKAVNLVAKAIAGSANANTKDEIGRVMATQGPAVYRIANELLRSAQATNANAAGINRFVGNQNWIPALTAPAGGRTAKR